MAVWSQWMSRIRDHTPEQPVLMVPGHYFYGHQFSFSPQMAKSDIDAFVELSIEGVSPFPVEQLAWGYLTDHENHRILVFATTGARLRSLLGEATDIEDFYLIAPGFLAHYGTTFERPTIRFLVASGSISAVFYPANSKIPEKFVSRPLPSEILTDDVAAAARSQLLKSLKTTGYSVEEGVWVCESWTLDDNERVQICHRNVGGYGQGDPVHHLTFSQEEFWKIDLRSSGTATKLERERLISRKLWQTARLCIFSLGVLLLLQIAYFGLSGWTKIREKAWLERAPAAQRVGDSEALASRLEQASEQTLQPIRMLELLNNPRPSTIFFTRTRSTVYNEMEVEGESREGIPSVNHYTDILRSLPQIVDVEHSAATRDGKTTFKMTVTFGPLEESFPEEDVASAGEANP